MTYETPDGARYGVLCLMGDFAICDISVVGVFYQAEQPELSELFPDRASAEAALKAYADAHPGWKVVEE